MQHWFTVEITVFHSINCTKCDYAINIDFMIMKLLRDDFFHTGLHRKLVSLGLISIKF